MGIGCRRFCRRQRRSGGREEKGFKGAPPAALGLGNRGSEEEEEEEEKLHSEAEAEEEEAEEEGGRLAFSLSLLTLTLSSLLSLPPCHDPTSDKKRFLGSGCTVTL